MSEEQKDQPEERVKRFAPDVHTPLGHELADIITVFREFGASEGEIEGALHERVRAPYPASRP